MLSPGQIVFFLLCKLFPAWKNPPAVKVSGVGVSPQSKGRSSNFSTVSLNWPESPAQSNTATTSVLVLFSCSNGTVPSFPVFLLHVPALLSILTTLCIHTGCRWTVVHNNFTGTISDTQQIQQTGDRWCFTPTCPQIAVRHMRQHTRLSC